MARPRWTITLILVCSLPVLATVITAFRILDVPSKSIQQKSFKTDLRKSPDSDRCDECEVDTSATIGQKLHNLKIHSALHKRVHGETQETDESKQHITDIKKTTDRGKKKFIIDSEDNDKEDIQNENILKENKKVKSISIKKLKTGTEVKPTKKDKENHEEDEKDDDEDDIDDGKTSDVILHKQKYSVKSKPNVKQTIQSSGKNLLELKTKSKKDNRKNDDDDDDDDDDEEDDDDDNDDESRIKDIPSHGKNQPLKVNEEKPAFKITFEFDKNNVYNDSDDDDDDDDDDDEDDDSEEYYQKKEKDVKKQSQSEAITKSSESSKNEAESSNKVTSKRKTETSEKPNDQLKLKKESLSEKKQTTQLPSIEEQKSVDTKEKVSSKQNEYIKKDQIETKVEADKLKQSNKTEKNKISLETKRREDQKEKTVQLKKDSLENKTKTKIDKEKINKDAEKNNKDFKKEYVKKGHEIENQEIDQVIPKKTDSMKHVSDAVYRRNMLISEFEDFYSFFPTFSPNFSRIHNVECRRHGQILLRQLRGTKLWALNMLDATAKIPSGILQGNSIQLGNFDQCIYSKARVQLDTGSVVKVQGKYCLAYVDVKAEHPELEVPVHLAQAKNLLNSRIDDPGHFIPRFSTLSWGVCVPAACGPQDAEVVIRDALKLYQHTTGLVIRVKVDDHDCHVDDSGDWDKWLEMPTMLTLAFYFIILLLVIIATLQDFLGRRKSDEGNQDEKAECDQDDPKNEGQTAAAGGQTKDKSEGILSLFSLYQTLKKLVGPVSYDDIGCIHGIRALSTLVLLAAHKFIPVAFTPYHNRLKLTETVSAPWWSGFRSGWIYTDCFLLLSGTLSARRLTEDDSAPRRLFIRYLRLTPAHLAVILFYAYIWDNLSDGPLWGSLVTRNADLCRDGWWWNLLYVHNYFNFEEMCAPQTHHLALDMQMSILAAVLVWLASSKPTTSKVLILLLQAAAAYSRYSTVSEHRLTMLIYHGVSVSQLYRTARLSYTSTLHRSTPYLMGVVLGLALNKPSDINKVISILCWMTASFLMGIVWWAGVDSGDVTHRYNVTFAAKYAALAPLAVSYSLALFIFTIHNGGADFFNRLFSTRPLLLISRLSYAIYLCQFIVFFTNAATTRSSSEFTVMSLIDVKEISAIFLASIVLTVTLVIPMQSIHKYVLPSHHTPSRVSETVETVEESSNPPEIEEEKKVEAPVTRTRSILAHREVLEEIPEAEVEYEFQRERKDEGLEGILEEEEDEDLAEEEYIDRIEEEEEIEMMEGEDAVDDNHLNERQPEFVSRRHYVSNDDDQELEDWEWTNNVRNGAQYWHSR